MFWGKISKNGQIYHHKKLWSAERGGAGARASPKYATAPLHHSLLVSGVTDSPSPARLFSTNRALDGSDWFFIVCWNNGLFDAANAQVIYSIRLRLCCCCCCCCWRRRHWLTGAVIHTSRQWFWPLWSGTDTRHVCWLPMNLTTQIIAWHW